jgi:hypothetical protein
MIETMLFLGYLTIADRAGGLRKPLENIDSEQRSATERKREI